MCQCVSNRIFEVPYRYSVQGKAKLALRSAAFGTWLSVTSEGATWQNNAAILLGFSQRIGGLFCARSGLIYGWWWCWTQSQHLSKISNTAQVLMTEAKRWQSFRYFQNFPDLSSISIQISCAIGMWTCKLVALQEVTQAENRSAWEDWVVYFWGAKTGIETQMKPTGRNRCAQQLLKGILQP
jgi:hypothetical protein